MLISMLKWCIQIIRVNLRTIFYTDMNILLQNCHYLVRETPYADKIDELWKRFQIVTIREQWSKQWELKLNPLKYQVKSFTLQPYPVVIVDKNKGTSTIEVIGSPTSQVMIFIEGIFISNF